MTETDATLFTTLPNKTTTAHTIMINKLPPPPQKWQKQVTEKTFQEMYINVGMANCENDPNKNGMTYASHTLPSLHLFTPHQLTAPPNTHCMPITYPFIIIHAIHKIPYHSIHNSTIAPHAQIQSFKVLVQSQL